jgi:hypothetical protein
MHTKKGAQGGNPIENLIGTSGTPAAADAVAELKRYPQGAGKLTITGRSVPAEDFERVFNGCEGATSHDCQLPVFSA